MVKEDFFTFFTITEPRWFFDHNTAMAILYTVCIRFSKIKFYHIFVPLVSKFAPKTISPCANTKTPGPFKSGYSLPFVPACTTGFRVRTIKFRHAGALTVSAHPVGRRIFIFPVGNDVFRNAWYKSRYKSLAKIRRYTLKEYGRTLPETMQRGNRRLRGENFGTDYRLQ